MTAVPQLLLHRCSIDTDRIYKDKVFETLENNELEVLSRYWFIKLCGGGRKGRRERERERERREKGVYSVIFYCIHCRRRSGYGTLLVAYSQLCMYRY